LGHPATLSNSILCLRRRGRHVQVGLLLGDQSRPPVPMDRVIGWELELKGSHGMQAHRYGAMFNMIGTGKLQPEKLIGRTLSLAEAPQALMEMDRFAGVGIGIITSF
jgi:alcohol dehydrogenase